jgi:hypothetical protein
MTNAQEWDVIRERWAEVMPHIAAGGRCDPYFHEWRFTPIEVQAWNCIRRIGLVLYPQVPVGGVFVDFGNPYWKVGVELDGKDYHSRDRDTLRDEKLWALGWRIYRITGSESVKWSHPPTEPNFANDARRRSEEWYRALAEWTVSTGDGVLWSLHLLYQRAKHATAEERDIAVRALNHHRLVDFPLPGDDLEDEDL